MSIVYEWLQIVNACDEPVLFIRFLDLLIREGYGNPDEYIQLLFRFTTDYTGSLINQVEKAFELEQQCNRWKKDDQAKKASSIRQAEYYISKARSLGNNDLRDILIASDLLKKAYVIYKNHHMKEQANNVIKQLDNIQVNASRFYHTATRELDCEPIFRDIQDRMQGLNTEERFLALVLLTPVLKKTEIEEIVKEGENTYLSLASTEIKDHEGKTIAILPSLQFCDDQEYEKNLEQHIHYLMSKYEEFNGFLLFGIKQLFLKECIITRDMISILTENNSMIPAGREDLFLSAIELFLAGKEIEALYILVPQIEHALRTLAKEVGGAITKLKEEHEEVLSLEPVFSIPELQESYDENLLFLFRSMLIESAGGNIRNETAHGLLGKENTSHFICTYFICFIMKWLSYTAPRFHQYLANDKRIIEALKQSEQAKAKEEHTMKFYKIDDQIVISDKALTVGEELTANTTDGAHEKHVPVIEQNGDVVTVKVGSVEHPSLEAHYIEWIILVTEAGFQIHYLKPGMKPEATFKVNEKPISAYEYCNLHGLWKADV